MSDEPVGKEAEAATEAGPFDFRAELISLYHSAGNFDQKHRALALMEKVGGFVSPANPADAGGSKGDRDLDKPDPTAQAVLDKINGKK